LTKRLLEKALKAEMRDHLGYDKYDRTDVNNARNGSSQKKLISNNGVIAIDIPRDREAAFEPVIIPKRQTRIDGLDQKILSLYAKGMSVADIRYKTLDLT
jgi:putative transposase